jgi:hypothetical protein
MKHTFPIALNKLRINANFNHQELADLAKVPRSFISALHSGQRAAGELQARRIGQALGLCDVELEDFVFLALNACTHKVLLECQPYPAVVLNLVASQLNAAGVHPNEIQDVQISTPYRSEVSLHLSGGRQAVVQTSITLN